MSIPKVIHYCWFGGAPLDDRSKECISSWEKYCPDYEIIRWDETNFDVSQNEYMREAYDAGKWAFVTDVARLMIILEHGGFYFDTDVELVKSLDDLTSLDAFFGKEEPFTINTGIGFGARPQHAAVAAMLKDYDGIHFTLGKGVYDLQPCPYRNSKVLVDNGLKDVESVQTLTVDGDEVRVFPKEYFCPRDYETGEMNLTDNSFSIHWYGASWLSAEAKKNIECAENFQKTHGKLASFIYWRITDYKNQFGSFNVKNVLQFSVSQVQFYSKKLLRK